MRSIAAVAVGLLLSLGSVYGQEAVPGPDRHPLEPAGTSSPRATLETFLNGMNRAWELYVAEDPDSQKHFAAARSCLDVSEVPPNSATKASKDYALILKEILDRLELPALAAVPGRQEVMDGGLTRWTIPHTEIELVRVSDGPRQGDFLFSPETLARSRGDYQRVRDLPYRPGKLGAHYDEFRFGVESRVLAGLLPRLPQWAKEEYGGQKGWQWVILAALVALSIGLAGASIALGRRLSRSTGRLALFFGPLLSPVVLSSLQWIIPPLAPWPTTLGGPGVSAIGLGLRVTAYVGVAWLATVLIRKAATLVIHLSDAEDRPLHQQLILVCSRILALIAVAVVFFKGGQSLGMPLSALVTGLGVGGLAVALSAQSTLENLIGGINLFADRPVKIGEVCKFGDQLGVVEGIGLRSTRIRTLGRTVVSIPNSTFAKMELENLSRRDRNLLRTTLRLEYGTSAAQVEAVLAALREVFFADDRIAVESRRIRLFDLGRDALEIEVFVYVLTADWNEYLGIREDLLLKAMRIVDESGLRLALPAERHEIAQTASEEARSA